MINKKTLSLSLYFGGTILFMLVANVQADSQRIQWDNNKHFYQRFDQKITWTDARDKCVNKGAHLVTITSAEEGGFIYNNLYSNYFWIGASDAKVEGRFAWVTNEKWGYDLVDDTDSSGGEDYVYARNSGSSWQTGTITETVGTYICEWSADNYVGLAIVPDMNGNGSDEIAVLYIDYVTTKHTVKIRDPKTDKTLSTLTFKSGLQAPQGVVALEDINGNGVSEIGVLYTEFGRPSVGIKDANNDKAYLNTLRFLNRAYTPVQITVSPDSNGNGSSEITVLGIGKTNKTPKAETRDSSTGTR
ncbi:MAG: lectin-like protein, partial [Methylococcales bacterium]|nr:lectin-like protein [Methylococcales bacterium]